MIARSERFRASGPGSPELHALHRGDPSGPTLVLLHGGGANARWWDDAAVPLAERARVVALDFRGHGESEFPDALEVGAFHRDLEALLDHLGARDPILVGHSMGGQVALDVAARRGARAVVAVEVAAGGGERDRTRLRRALAARRSYRTREEAIARFRLLPPSRGVSEELRRRIAERSVREESDGRFGFRFDPRWFGLPPAPSEPREAIRCPVLVVRGGESSILTAEGARGLASVLPSARLLEIAGAGHNAHLEQPGEFLRATLAFLAETA